MRTILLAMFLALSGTAIADANEMNAGDAPQAAEIPTTEKEFVAVINNFDMPKIIEQFGEPSKKEDITLHKSGKVVASIWQYHFINTAVDGQYYETTELDFVDGKVVTVVFMNNDGSDVEAGTKATPPVKPDL